MQYRRLGDAGMKVSAVSLGAWITYGGSVADPTALDCLRTAVEHGINFIDTADIYEKGEAEKVVGAFLKEQLDLDESETEKMLEYCNGSFLGIYNTVAWVAGDKISKSDMAAFLDGLNKEMRAAVGKAA